MFNGHCVADPRAIIVVTDGNGLFGFVVDAVRIMQIPQLLPPLLVVGLGYPGARTVSDATELGNHDLTPTAWVRRCGNLATASAAAASSAGKLPRHTDSTDVVAIGPSCYCAERTRTAPHARWTRDGAAETKKKAAPEAACSAVNWTFMGGDDGTRTHDPLLAKQVHYQLCYVPGSRQERPTGEG
jgi:hypothetical protein